MRDGIAMLTYSNADIVRDNVFVRDGQTWAQLIEQRTGARMRGAPVMRIYTLEWFRQQISYDERNCQLSAMPERW